MARLPRLCLPGMPHHVIQRGNNRQACFAAREDYITYAHYLEEYAREHSVALHGWVFMTNHVHMLATPQTPDGLSRMMQTLGRRYVRYFNHRYDRTGTLWEGRFRSGVVAGEDYLLVCLRYIELNPVRAGMVADPGAYPWSSFPANALGRHIKLWTPHPVYLNLGPTPVERTSAYRELFEGQIDAATLKQIRDATNQGLALGSDQSKAEIADLAGRRVTLLKRGPRNLGLGVRVKIRSPF